MVLHHAAQFFWFVRAEVALQDMFNLPVVLSLRYIVVVPAAGQVFSIMCSRGSVLHLFWDLYRHSVLCLSPHLPSCAFLSREQSGGEPVAVARVPEESGHSRDSVRPE